MLPRAWLLWASQASALRSQCPATSRRGWAWRRRGPSLWGAARGASGGRRRVPRALMRHPTQRWGWGFSRRPRGLRAAGASTAGPTHSTPRVSVLPAGVGSPACPRPLATRPHSAAGSARLGTPAASRASRRPREAGGPDPQGVRRGRPECSGACPSPGPCFPGRGHRAGGERRGAGSRGGRSPSDSAGHARPVLSRTRCHGRARARWRHGAAPA